MLCTTPACFSTFIDLLWSLLHLWTSIIRIVGKVSNYTILCEKLTNKVVVMFSQWNNLEIDNLLAVDFS